MSEQIKNSIRAWKNGNYKIFIFKIILSLLLSLLTCFAITIDFFSKGLLLFLFLFFMFYISLEISFFFIYKNTSIIYQKFISSLKILKQKIIHKNAIDLKTAYEINILFSFFIDSFLKGCIGQKFLTTNFYDPKIEKNKILSHKKELSRIYLDFLEREIKDKDKLKILLEKLQISINIMTSNIINLIENVFNIPERQTLFEAELIYFFDSFINEYIKLCGK